jgi:Icc-related predicted phosphoesterase
MRWLQVSDLHYTLKQFDWLDSVASDFDLIVIAGDHLDIVAVAAGDAQIIVILKYLRRLRAKTRVVVSSGNHDLTGTDEHGEQVAKWLRKVRALDIPVDGDVLEFGDVMFTICPWWDGPQGKAEVGRQLTRDAARRTGPWVWVYHAPPDQSPVSWTGRQYYGDSDLRGWIGEHRPDMVLTGHIHQSPFRKGGSWVDRVASSWVFNAGRQIGPCPTHIVVDTDAKQATWFSLAGTDVLDLSNPEARPVALTA